jgi:hypothetical protein
VLVEAHMPEAARSSSARTRTGIEIRACPSSRSSWCQRSSERAPGTCSKTPRVRAATPEAAPQRSGRLVAWTWRWAASTVAITASWRA